jgi:NADH-quinone oxidoreductase subunit N
MAPEIVLTLLGILLILVAVFTRTPDHRVNRAVPAIAILGLVLALASVVMVAAGLHGTGLDVDRGGHLRVDILSLFFKGIAITATIVVVLMAVEYSRRFDSPGEFFGLIVFTVLAVCLLSSAADLVTIYLSMEFLSITSYAMAGFYRENARSNEAAMKYFLYGAVNSALMLYGISLLYGLSSTLVPGTAAHTPASTNLSQVIRALTTEPVTPLSMAAVVFTLAGFLFKVSAVPFHQWAPDTYEGAPTPFTAFLSVASKMGGLAILVRVVAGIFLVPNAMLGDATLTSVVALLIAIVAGLSMTVGNVIAIQQRDLKRMLAYSGIAQVGYMLIAVAAMTSGNSDKAIQALIIYAFVYLFMNLGAFGVVTAINNRLNSSDIDDFVGLHHRAPWLAMSMAIFLLGLAGVPPAGGWFGKLYIFKAAVDPSLHGVFSGGAWNATDVLAILLVVNSVIAAYYYLNVIKRMYFDEAPHGSTISVGPALRAGIVLSLVVTLFLGTLPLWLYNLVTENATFRPDAPRITAQDAEVRLQDSVR